MLLLTTYIPFYFFTIFLTFLICFTLLYFLELKIILGRYGRFSKDNKICVGLCVLAVLCSLLPGILFYQEAGSGELALPKRHTNSTVENVLAVDKGTITKWGMTEDLVYAGAFQDYRQIKFAVMYIPGFVYILLFLGMVMPVNKKLVLFFIWSGMLFFIHSPYVSLYHFLYQHVFYFKYFRNLHFFLWLILLPVFILFSVEQFRLFLSYRLKTQKEKKGMIAFIFLIHSGSALMLYMQGNTLLSTYGVLLLSLVFFVQRFKFLTLTSGKEGSGLMIFFLLIIVSIQPLEVYQYLYKNSGRPKLEPYRYDETYLDFSFTRGERENTGIYAAMKGYHLLSQNIGHDSLWQYRRVKFFVYDHVQPVDGEDWNFKKIKRAFEENRNLAFVSRAGLGNGISEDMGKGPTSQAQMIMKNSDQFQVLKYDSNSIKIKTHFNTRKFLVYNDNFHKGWQAFINGKKTDIFLANGAFKGLWIPLGENIIYFRYGAAWQYFLNYRKVYSPGKTDKFKCLLRLCGQGLFKRFQCFFIAALFKINNT